MGLGIDTVTKSLYVLVGLARLHGETKEDNPYGQSLFVVLSVILGLLTFALILLPVPKAVPAYLFLLMQIMSICEDYDTKGRVRDAPAAIALVSVFGICLYFASRRYDEYRNSKTGSSDLSDKIVNQDVGSGASED